MVHDGLYPQNTWDFAHFQGGFIAVSQADSKSQELKRMLRERPVAIEPVSQADSKSQELKLARAAYALPELSVSQADSKSQELKRALRGLRLVPRLPYHKQIQRAKN